MLYFVQGVVFLFDASNKNSFLRLQEYYKLIHFYNFQKTGIIATKKDICTEKDKYKYHQLKKFCKEYEAIPFFLSVKKNKKDIYNFINLFCPTLIPSLVNKKKEIKFEYPYTKTVVNNFPKENYLDKAIVKKLKEDDSSYESEKEEEKDKEKNKEEIIKEYIKKKEIEKNYIKRKKINTVFNINIEGNGNKIIYDYKNKNFNDVMGQINLDLGKLFRKYRPDSDEKNKKDKKHKYKKYKDNEKKEDINYNNINQVNKENEKEEKSQIMEDKDDWVSINVDELIEQYMKTKDNFNKNVNKNNKNENKEQNDNDIKKSEKEISYKSDKSKNKENEREKDIITKNENIINNQEEKKENNIDENNKKDKEEEEENEEEEEKEEKDEKSEEADKKGEENNEDGKKKDKDNSEDDNYDNLSDDIQDFKQSLMNEAEGD